MTDKNEFGQLVFNAMAETSIHHMAATETLMKICGALIQGTAADEADAQYAAEMCGTWLKEGMLDMAMQQQLDDMAKH